MHFTIRSIILWPRSGAFSPREVPFQPGAVNVLSGQSRTGKSAIIPIIDYCLGSDKCSIPIGPIRDACSWFGVLVDTAQGQKLFARREPGAQRSTGDMYVSEGERVEIPAAPPEKNANVDFVKGLLDDLAGLTSLDFEPTSTGFKGRPSFRDLMAFTFQPQNIVANPNTLFFKADSFEHREKLRTIFPYVLGAITPELLAKKHELDELKRELRRKKLDLQNIRDVSQRFLAELGAHLARAVELGLLSPEDGSGVSVEAIPLLKGIVEQNRDTLAVTATKQGIEVSGNLLLELRKRELEQSTELAGLRQRFLEMSELRANSIDYRGALQAQKDRLAISSWLRHRSEAASDCPVCGNAMTKQEEKLEALLTHLEEIENAAQQFSAVPASFDREYQRVRSEMERLADELKATQFRLRELRGYSDIERKRQYTELSASRFIGRLEADLRVLESVGQDSELQEEVNDLQQRVSDLQKEVDPSGIAQRTRRALAKVSSYAARILPELDVERPNDTMLISIQDLTVKIEAPDRDDYLWEIGSGSNWLSYHIAASVALQLFFGDIQDSPVPRFLVYDQPSQVYFPQRITDKPSSEGEKEPEFEDEEVKAVRKVFKVLSSAIEQSGNVLQVIVTDHAPERVWEGVPNVNYVEEWRGGVKLVPTAWLAPPHP